MNTPHRSKRRVPPPNPQAERPASWGPWEWRPYVAEHVEQLTAEVGIRLNPDGWFQHLVNAALNAVYSVQFYKHRTRWGEVDHLMIRRHDGQPIREWSDVQCIKNDLCGPERTAIEVYPPQSQVIDQANLYHLWVLPDGKHLPFGLDKAHMDATLVRKDGAQ